MNKTEERRHSRASELLGFDKQKGMSACVLAGMDEVGRGPLAGPVVAACVVMPEEPLLIWVDDSKKLSEKRRDILYEEIIKNARYIGVGQSSHERIDDINILEATKEAMRDAASQIPADIFLIDAVTGLKLKGKEIPIIGGDALSYNIAAASIVAKVTRDRMMLDFDRQYPEYGFARNKGYGTREHIEALKRCGPCPIHRRTFIGKLT